MLIPLAAILLPVVLVPVILGMKQARLDRELEHAERIKALEVGRSLPQDEPWWTPARVSVAIGVWVPVGVFFCAWMASLNIGYEGGVWFAATAVGTAAVACGSALAYKQLTLPSPAEPQRADKPPVDADAFDVVGRRG
jgi:hypothetical protein